MPINRFDQAIVDNLRREYGDRIKAYPDEQIAKAWRDFSQSEDYPDTDRKNFPVWCEMEFE